MSSSLTESRERLRALEPVVRALMHEGDVPGLAIAVAVDGQTLLAEGYGFLDLETRRPLTPRTVLGVGSVSKVFTATAILRLVDEGRLSTDDPVTRWLPSLQAPRAEAITVHHLLTHTSGLPPLPCRYHAFDRAQPRVFSGGAMDRPAEALAGPISERAGFRDCEGLVRFLAGLEIEPLGEPGELFSYSNEGYILLGGILESVSGMPYERTLGQQVIDPLGLQRTTVGSEGLDPFEDVALPHHRVSGKPCAVPHWDAPAWAAPGGVLSSVLDLVRFLDLLHQRTPLLSSGLVERMLTPHATDLATGFGYGYGLEIVPDHHGVTLVGHSGGRDGVSAYALVVPERGITVAALCNLDGPVPDLVTWVAVNALLGLPTDTPPEVFRPLEATPDELASCAGTYASAEGLCLRLTYRDSTLGAELDGNEVPCAPLSVDRVLVSGVPVRFLRRGTEVWAAAIGGRIVRRTD